MEEQPFTKYCQFPNPNFLEFVVADILLRKAVFYKESFEFVIPSVHIVKVMATGEEVGTADVVKAVWSYIEEALVAGELFLGINVQADAHLTDYVLSTTKNAIVYGLTKRIDDKQKFTLKIRYHARLTQTVEHWFLND